MQRQGRCFAIDDRVDWYSGWDIIYTFFQEISWYFEMRIIRVRRIDAAPNSIKIRSRTGAFLLFYFVISSSLVPSVASFRILAGDIPYIFLKVV